jgi:alkanesulfonate monooxygenase SsuD/methylene tetrahydromethanopterin reductase-like flavin-dependent oxidoreductase (luciferase family)
VSSRPGSWFESMNVAVACHVHVTVTEPRPRPLGAPLAAGVDAHTLCGTPDQIADGLAEPQDVGVTYVLLILETNSAQLRQCGGDIRSTPVGLAQAPRSLCR